MNLKFRGNAKPQKPASRVFALFKKDPERKYEQVKKELENTELRLKLEKRKLARIKENPEFVNEIAGKLEKNFARASIIGKTMGKTALGVILWLNMIPSPVWKLIYSGIFLVAGFIFSIARISPDCYDYRKAVTSIIEERIAELNHKVRALMNEIRELSKTSSP